MGRANVKYGKRSKRAKSIKKSWIGRQCTKQNAQIFDDVAYCVESDRESDDMEVTQQASGSNNYCSQAGTSTETQNTQIPSETLNDNLNIDDDMEWQDCETLKRTNPTWCGKVYTAKPSKRLYRSFSTSGVMHADEYNDIVNYPLAVEKAEKEKPVIEGNRIVELGYVLEWAVPLQYNHSKVCSSGKLYISSEKMVGLRSIIVFRCTMCRKQYEFGTESAQKKENIDDTNQQTDQRKSSINYGAVWGTLATGSTYGHLEEFLACMNIPQMSANMFYDIENEIGDSWKASLWKVMHEAGAKERDLAIQKEQICSDGTPWISVYLDASWAQRSYGSNWNSLSGMAVIIGKATNQPVFIGVRNRFCSICERAANKGEEPKEHTCYKNWTTSAPAMESDIIVEGFCQSQEMHGVKYLEFVADGDANTFAKIKEKVPYGREVKKIECTNHALKNYGKHLRTIKKDTHINVNGRKLLTDKKIKLLTKRAKTSIYEHSQQNEPDVNLLKYDIRNNLHHVFGDHSGCTRFCNNIGDDSDNKIPKLKETGMYDHLYGVHTLLIRKAHLLIKNENNNRAERFMNIVARFNMGKRLNLIQRGSYTHRVYASGLRYSKSFQWHVSPWKRCMKKSPGQYFKHYIATKTARKDKGDTKAKKQLFKRPVGQSTSSTNSASYGVNAEQPEEPAETEFIMMEAQLQTMKLNITQEEITKIQTQSVGQFGNPVYDQEREKRLTASLFGRVVKRLPHTPCHNIVKACLKPSVFTSEATEYGVINEPVVLKKFNEITKLTVKSSGLWVDKTYGCLAASPDGLIGDSALVEVKCIYAPDITNVSNLDQLLDAFKKEKKHQNICLQKTKNGIKLKRKHNYYYQVQGQLNITQRQLCYFVVYVNDEIPLHIEEITRDTQFWEEKMLPVLLKFYTNCIAPEIIRGRLKKDTKCIDPPYILEQIELYKKKKEEKQRNKKK